jgi:cytoplasmic iron level regulating protein YaaA (DUF328/UPF0246 family)
MVIINERIVVMIMKESYTIDFNQKTILDRNNNKVKGAINLLRLFVQQEKIEEPNNINNHSYIGAIKKHLKNKLKIATIDGETNFINNQNTCEKNRIGEFDEKNTIHKRKKTQNDKVSHNVGLIEHEMKNILSSLPSEKLKNKKIKKLLIIGCSDSKDISNPINEKNISFDYFAKELKETRQKQVNSYIKMLDDEKNQKYFTKNRNVGESKKKVDSNYFLDSLSGSLYHAIDLYGNNHSTFFNKSMKEFYKILMEEYNFQLLIISGLYGVLEPYDTIRDYHLEITKIPSWTKNNYLQVAIENYIKTMEIENNLVFYSLSQKYIKAIEPNYTWNNLWLNKHGRGHLQAKYLKRILSDNPI